jgi:hypothetical protein
MLVKVPCTQLEYRAGLTEILQKCILSFFVDKMTGQNNHCLMIEGINEMVL